MNALYYLDSKDNTSRYRILYENCMDIMYNRSGSVEDAVTAYNKHTTNKYILT